MVFFEGRLTCRIFQQATISFVFLFKLRECGCVAVDCQQMFNGNVNRFDHLFENYVIVFATLYPIRPQRFRFTLLDGVVTGFSNQIACRFRRNH